MVSSLDVFGMNEMLGCLDKMGPCYNAKSKASQSCFYLSLVVAKPFTLLGKLFVTGLSFAILVLCCYYSQTLDVT